MSIVGLEAREFLVEAESFWV